MSQLIRLLAVTALSSLFSLTSLAAAEYDTVISNGRVIDPETGLDAVRNIGISGNRIVAISASPLEGDHEIDATALVVAPGFIDLHAHGQSQESNEYQARDGVTTALELESGIPNLRAWLAAKEGSSLINYGASVSHNAARTAVMEDYAPKLARLNELIETYGEGWPEVQQYRIQEIDPADYESLDTSQIQSMNEFIKAELDAGGIGIGLLVGYLPGASQDEIFRLFESAAEASAPIFAHVRDPGIVGIQEVMTNAITLGTPLHIVHINSMALGDITLAIDLVEAAQNKGFDVTTELYPYTAGSTFIQSSLFDDGWQERFNIGYEDLQWVATGERLNRETFARYRETGGILILHMMQESWIQSGLRRESTMIASDGMPYAPGAHPRSAGTFSRVLGKYVREDNILPLSEAINKMTLMPAQRLEAFVPAAQHKGRIQVGADADITIFDPEKVIDRASFEDGLQFSEGIQHVLVNGVLVVNDGETVADVSPGQALMGRFRR